MDLGHTDDPSPSVNVAGGDLPCLVQAQRSVADKSLSASSIVFWNALRNVRDVWTNFVPRVSSRADRTFARTVASPSKAKVARTRQIASSASILPSISFRFVF